MSHRANAKPECFNGDYGLFKTPPVTCRTMQIWPTGDEPFCCEEQAKTSGDWVKAPGTFRCATLHAWPRVCMPVAGIICNNSICLTALAPLTSPAPDPGKFTCARKRFRFGHMPCAGLLVSPLPDHSHEDTQPHLVAASQQATLDVTC